MKKFWFKLNTWNQELITTAIEAGVDAVYVPPENVAQVRALAKVPTISSDSQADLVIGDRVAEVLLDSQEKEQEVTQYQGKIPVIVYSSDWSIIPLENLIAKTSNLIQQVKSSQEAEIAFGILEKGVDGVLLETEDMAEIKQVGKLVQDCHNEPLPLTEAEIVAVEPVGMGDRVVVDACSLLRPGQGMLVGNSAAAMFLVHNENVENPYCAPRPFRVNAGGVHAYIRMPDNTTKYLAELCSGSRVAIVDPQGNTQEAIVGRVKIEKRPMLLIEAKVAETRCSLIAQNAETIRLTKPDGGYISVVQLQAGDRVLAFIEEKGIGRHFGMKVVETVEEK